MKNKKMSALAALMIALVALIIALEGTVSLYQDYETGVQYIVFKCSSAGGIFPLLADAAEEAQKSFSELGNALREVNT